MPTRPFTRGLAALSLASLLGLAACGDAGPSRQPVSGMITLDGKPFWTRTWSRGLPDRAESGGTS